MKVHFTAAFSILVGIAIGGIAVRGLNAQTRPPAYVIGEIEVADQENYAKEYLSRSQKPIITDGGGKFLSRGSKTISIRGEPPRRIVLLAFESLDRAQAAFNSPAYAEALMYGERYAKFRIFAVEGCRNRAFEPRPLVR
ncbi:MAG: DUF1330 domain-containing protein [Pseudolabrys sp.]|jgi:uncharacterized protein (DUF1330 family)